MSLIELLHSQNSCGRGWLQHAGNYWPLLCFTPPYAPTKFLSSRFLLSCDTTHQFANTQTTHLPRSLFTGILTRPLTPQEARLFLLSSLSLSLSPHLLSRWLLSGRRFLHPKTCFETVILTNFTAKICSE